MKKMFSIKRVIVIGLLALIVAHLIYLQLQVNSKQLALENEQNINKNKVESTNMNYGIFNNYYELACSKVKELTLEQKIGQMLLVSYDSKEDTHSYGGVLFFEKDFKDKSIEQVKQMISSIYSISQIPLLTAVDEEGKNGTNGVVRVSSNRKLTSCNEYLKGNTFSNAQTLYSLGGFQLIHTDTIEKSKFLYQLGLNLNLAPIADICQKGDYMYHRSIGLDEYGTSTYIKTVLSASKKAKKDGNEVSYCLKHFPGYGSNLDTHIGLSKDSRTIEEIKKDIISFEVGIKEGAEAIMISHNIISSIDGSNPASISSNINKLLRKDLNFTGIIITDALNMKALNSIEGNKYVKAVLAGNDILIVTDGKLALQDIKNAVLEGQIGEEIINDAVTRIIAWKYYKNML